jgi:hypothetical protein
MRKKITVIMLTLSLVLLLIFALPVAAQDSFVKENVTLSAPVNDAAGAGTVTIDGWCVSGPWWF